MLRWTLGAVLVPVPRVVAPLARRGALLLGVVGGAADEAPRPAPSGVPVRALDPVGSILRVAPPCLEFREPCRCSLCFYVLHFLNQLG